MNIQQEYLSMGFMLMPCGKENHHKWYCRKFVKGSARDSTWKWDRGFERVPLHGFHSCCGSRKAYCHLVGCRNRVELLADDDYSDLIIPANM